MLALRYPANMGGERHDRFKVLRIIRAATSEHSHRCGLILYSSPMIEKILPPLIAIGTGALMFAAGTVVPESIRQKVAEPAEQLFGQLAAVTNSVTGAEKEDSASAENASTASPATAGAAAAAPAAAKAEPIPIQDLLIPSPLPDKAQYALQAGQFESVEDANALGARIKAAKLPFDKVIEVIDQGGKQWSIVPIGPYDSADAARTARMPVAQALGIDLSLPLILLPPPKPKG